MKKILKRTLIVIGSLFLLLTIIGIVGHLADPEGMEKRKKERAEKDKVEYEERLQEMEAEGIENLPYNESELQDDDFCYCVFDATMGGDYIQGDKVVKMKEVDAGEYAVKTTYKRCKEIDGDVISPIEFYEIDEEHRDPQRANMYLRQK